MIILSDPVAMVIDCHGAALVTDGGGHWVEEREGGLGLPDTHPPLLLSVVYAF